MGARIWLAARMDMHDLRRRPLLLVLLFITPVIFISRAITLTQRIPRAIGLPGGGTTLTTMRDVHGAVMAAITVAFLGGLIGVFTMQAAKQADRRLVLAGFRGVETVIARLIVLFVATGIALLIALVVTARDFAPMSWSWFACGTAAIAITYAGIGALAGTLFGRVGATYLLLFLAMLDLGVVQNPMFGNGSPPRWAVILPGYSGIRIVIAAGFAHASRAPTPELVGAAVWAVGLTAIVIWSLGNAMQLPSAVTG